MSLRVASREPMVLGIRPGSFIASAARDHAVDAPHGPDIIALEKSPERP